LRLGPLQQILGSSFMGFFFTIYLSYFRCVLSSLGPTPPHPLLPLPFPLLYLPAVRTLCLRQPFPVLSVPFCPIHLQPIKRTSFPTNTNGEIPSKAFPFFFLPPVYPWALCPHLSAVLRVVILYLQHRLAKGRTDLPPRIQVLFHVFVCPLPNTGSAYVHSFTLLRAYPKDLFF